MAKLARCISLLVIFACGSVDGPSKSYDEHLEAWREAEPAAYEFEYAQQCFCAQSGVWWRIQVNNGVFVSATLVDASSSSTVSARHLTIDSVFFEAKRALDDKNATVGITYDPIWHNPSAVRVDPLKNAIDDEWELLVRAVKVTS